MKAAILKKAKELSIEEIQEPNSPPPGFVKVAIKSVGLCGSDIHYYERGSIGSFKLKKPMILGHEVGGVITEVGEGVTHKVGEIVALEPGIPCEDCEYCLTGNYNLCKDIKFFATPPIDGAMTEYVIHPAKYTFIAEGLTPAEASLAEPLSVGIHALKSCSIQLNDSMAIIGAGPVGLLTAFIARLRGANLTVFDIREDRVDLAKKLGFSAIVFNKNLEKMYNIIVDCTGNKDAIEWGQLVTRPGGTIVLVGMGEEGKMQLEGLDLVLRGISVHGVFRYANTYPTALELIKVHQDELSVFTENQINLENLPEYLNKRTHDDYIKTIVNI